MANSINHLAQNRIRRIIGNKWPPMTPVHRIGEGEAIFPFVRGVEGGRKCSLLSTILRCQLSQIKYDF